jgi:hypothetical protein
LLESGSKFEFRFGSQENGQGTVPGDMPLPYIEETNRFLIVKCMAGHTGNQPGHTGQILGLGEMLLCMPGMTGCEHGHTGQNYCVCPVIPAYSPVGPSEQRHLHFLSFFWVVYGVKKDVAFLWKRIGMNLSHESTKYFDSLLIVRDPYTQKQTRKKKNYHVVLFRTLSSSLSTLFSFLHCDPTL